MVFCFFLFSFSLQSSSISSCGVTCAPPLCRVGGCPPLCGPKAAFLYRLLPWRYAPRRRHLTLLPCCALGLVPDRGHFSSFINYHRLFTTTLFSSLLFFYLYFSCRAERPGRRLTDSLHVTFYYAILFVIIR